MHIFKEYNERPKIGCDIIIQQLNPSKYELNYIER